MDFGIIVVDDGSTDGTAEAISTAYRDVIIEHGNGELFWTGGIAQGMRRALREGAAFLFWLNDDCIPEPDALPRMLAYLENNPRTICGASCFVEGSSRPVETAFRQRRPLSASSNIAEVHGLSGYCVGMPATVCGEIGFPEARRLPHYGADSIYTLTAHRRGYRVALLDDAHVNLLDAKTAQTLEERARSSQSNRLAFIREAFFRRKSPFFLKSQYWYHHYKYGFFLGGLLFLVKVLRWTWTVLFYCRRRSLPSVSEETGSK